MTNLDPTTDPTAATSVTLDALALIPELKRACEIAGYVTLTPIQAASLPALLNGRDVLGQAKTGSGKTAAFALAALNALDLSLTGVQTLVLCPTRELATQVSNEFRKLASTLPNVKVLTLCGGVSLRPHLASLKHPPQVIVGTPGRILELIEAEALSLSALRVVVLDEADRLLDMGFADDVRAILSNAPVSRQTLLFSATFPAEVRELSHEIQREPEHVTVQSTLSETEIEQRFVGVKPDDKFDVLLGVLNQQRAPLVVVFCTQRNDTREVAERLNQLKVSALALHGELDQRERDEILLRFANFSASVLVATDIAARGLDIPALDVVINYDLATDSDAHIHRIGRTARAGRKGLAWTLVTPKEMPRARALEAEMGTLRWHAIKPARSVTVAAPANTTLRIDGGRQDKLRPGDILGALTGEAEVPVSAIGKIDIFATRSYVAIAREHAERALARLSKTRIKKLKLRVARI